MKNHSFWWWVNTSFQVLGTTALAFLPDIMQLLPKHTLLFKPALPIGAFVKTMKMRADYKKNENLPGGVVKVMDNIPDSITGVKGINSKETYIDNND